MIDINYLRENPQVVKENIKKRNKPHLIQLVDDFLNADSEWKTEKQKNDDLRHRRNKVSEEINLAKKQGKDASKFVNEAKEIPQKLAESDKKIAELQEKINFCWMRIPNLMHTSVPLGKTGEDNVEIKRVGTPKKFDFELLTHTELAEKLGVADFEQGREVSGQGFNYIKGELAILDNALQRYGVDFLIKKGFKLVVPPMLLNRETLSGAVDLSAFEEVIYKVENENLYLIGTAEHSLVSMLKNKVLRKDELPLRFCAVTPCFRKEIGGHGVDTKGLFRMHQFNKVEQVVYTTPEESFHMLEQMQKITEEFFESLEIPFRVIEICSGDLGGKFAKQYDIEAWFPRQNTYKEVTSAGNCTDYQARRLNINYLTSEGKRAVHILNNTMVATSRAMVAILENYQTKDGSVTIPKVLQKYCGFKTIP
ncbi:MAG: serine--tRNA ligase, partial [Nanoarchaeota archaeon]